jgi:hypothetical protein
VSEQNTIGDGPVESKYKEKMIELVRTLDIYFNGEAKVGARKTGFVLLVFDYNTHDGRCNYISNGAGREDIITLMKEQIKRFEGSPDVTGRA